MGVELFFSNRVENLARKYWDVVAVENECRGNDLSGPLTIIPNANLGKWLQMVTAAHQSICMNVDFDFLESGLWRLLSDLDTTADPVERLSIDKAQVLILNVLKSLRNPPDTLRAIMRYLEPGAEGAEQVNAARYWQLSEALARLFNEYEYNRSDMMRRWMKGAPVQDPLEEAQRWVYRQIRELLSGGLAEGVPKHRSLMAYADDLLGRPDLLIPDTGQFVHLFGLSQISPFHIQLIGRLVPYYDFYVYAVNPCREFWEDIRTPQEARWQRKKSSRRLRLLPEEEQTGELTSQALHPLLAAWGKPGRESVRLMCKLTDYDYQAFFETNGPATNVLHRLQDDILTLASDTDALKPDTSLQLAACPSIQREVETVYNSILYNLESDSSLQLTDIAVLVPDMNTYRPVVENVFLRQPQVLRFNLVDATASTESIYGQALKKIFALAFGNFTRSQVFDVLMNPCVMEKWEIGHEDLHTWIGWAEEARIFHSFDRAAKEKRGYAESPLYTWQLGLQRLRLGRIATTFAAGPTTRHPSTVASILPLNTIEGDDWERLEKLSYLLETLFNTAQTLRTTVARGPVWRQIVHHINQTYLAIPDQFGSEKTVQQSLFSALDNLALADQIPGKEYRSNWDGYLVWEFINGHLQGVSGGMGDYLTGGITVSALVPMRPIPFKLIYILGMEEGSFPGRADQFTLDLRLRKRKIGDITRPDRNRYLFLETLLSARQKLCITYIARDLQKDRIVQPCALVNQLLRYVNSRIVDHDEPLQPVEVPLHGSNPLYWQHSTDSMPSELLVNYSWRDRLANLRQDPHWPAIAKRAADEENALIAHYNPSFATGSEKNLTDTSGPFALHTRDLKGFLINPVKDHLQRHAGVHPHASIPEDLLDDEDEPFFSRFPENYLMVTTTLIAWVNEMLAQIRTGKSNGKIGPAQIRNLFEAVYRHFSHHSRTPEQSFAALDRSTLMEELQHKAELIHAFFGQTILGAPLYQSVTLGDPHWQDRPFDDRLPTYQAKPLLLELAPFDGTGTPGPQELALSCTMPWVWRSEADQWHVFVITGAGKATRFPSKHVIEPVLGYLVHLAGVDANSSYLWDAHSQFNVHVLYGDTIKSWGYRVSVNEARDYLAALACAQLDPQLPPWLPFTALEKSKQVLSLIAGDAGDAAASHEEHFYAILLEEYGKTNPAGRVRLADPQLPVNALDLARQRFSLFLNTVESVP